MDYENKPSVWPCLGLVDMGKAKHQRTENFKKVNYIIPTLLLVLVVGCNQQKRSADLKAHLTVSSLTALVQMPSDELKQLDIAQMNLLCAKGLLGAEHLDVTGSLAAIDQIATRARLETEQCRVALIRQKASEPER